MEGGASGGQRFVLMNTNSSDQLTNLHLLYVDDDDDEGLACIIM